MVVTNVGLQRISQLAIEILPADGSHIDRNSRWNIHQQDSSISLYLKRNQAPNNNEISDGGEKKLVVGRYAYFCVILLILSFNSTFL